MSADEQANTRRSKSERPNNKKSIENQTKQNVHIRTNVAQAFEHVDYIQKYPLQFFRYENEALYFLPLEKIDLYHRLLARIQRQQANELVCVF